MSRATQDIDNEFSFDAERRDEYQNSEEKLDIQHYLRILRKHKWPITLFTTVVTVLAAYYAFTATPIYRATSTLLIESQRQANVVSIEELVGGDSTSSDYYQTQFELLKSRQLAERVISYLDLWTSEELAGPQTVAVDSTGMQQGADVAADGAATGDTSTADATPQTLMQRIEGIFKPKPPVATATVDTAGPANEVVLDLGSENAMLDLPPVDEAMQATTRAALSDGRESREKLTERQQNSVISSFMGRVTIAPTRGTKLVNISYESVDPAFAAVVANTISEQYIDSYLDSKLEMTSRASDWLNDRLGDLKEQLDVSEDKLIAYKQANNLVDVNGSVGRLNEQELLLATTELAEARSALASASDVYNEVRAARGQPELLESIVAVQADPLIQNTRIEQGQRQRELDELLNRYGARHPRVVDARSRLASLNVTMQGHIVRVTGSIEKNYQLLQQRVATIQAKLASGKEEILELGTKRFELDELEREVLTKRDLYNTFYSRITEAKSADGLETANARISDYAVTPSFPVKPKKQLIVALAALASLVLSVLMAFLYEQMDATVKGINDIEEVIGLKLLGILPLIKNGFLGKVGARLPLNPLQIEDKKGTFFESVNTIRTAISLDDAAKPRKIVLVTSSVPGEGKSTTAINLAYSMGQLQRVLLIDCDMRRPSLSNAIGAPKDSPGLTNLITGTASARECIKRGVFEGHVDVLTTGPLPEQPLELLSSKRFEKILEKLGDYYDRIVIDSAPTQAVSDALVLSKLSDALIYVVKSHATEISLVKRGIQRLRQVGAPMAGAVITQVDIDKITAYGGDYYYQGYYDYYGYNSNGDKGKNKLHLSQAELLQMKSDDREVELDLDYATESGGGRSEFDMTQELHDTSEFTRRTRVRSSRKSADDMDIL